MKETLNLLPVRERARKKRPLAVYLLVGISVYSVLMLALWFMNTLQAKKLDSEIKSLDEKKKDLEKQMMLPLQARPLPTINKEIREMLRGAPEWGLLLSELSVIVPDDVWLGMIESKHDGALYSLLLKGFSKSHEGVSSFISRLESSAYFHDVEIVFSQKGAKDIAFELRAKLRWP